MQRSSELTCAYMSQLAVSNHLARIETPASETWRVDFSNFHCSYWSYLKSCTSWIQLIDTFIAVHTLRVADRCALRPLICLGNLWPLGRVATATCRWTEENQRLQFSCDSVQHLHCWLEDSFLIRGCASPCHKSQEKPSKHSQFEVQKVALALGSWLIPPGVRIF